MIMSLPNRALLDPKASTAPLATDRAAQGKTVNPKEREEGRSRGEFKDLVRREIEAAEKAEERAGKLEERAGEETALASDAQATPARQGERPVAEVERRQFLGSDTPNRDSRQLAESGPELKLVPNGDSAEALAQEAASQIARTELSAAISVAVLESELAAARQTRDGLELVKGKLAPTVGEQGTGEAKPQGESPAAEAPIDEVEVTGQKAAGAQAPSGASVVAAADSNIKDPGDAQKNGPAEAANSAASESVTAANNKGAENTGTDAQPQPQHSDAQAALAVPQVDVVGAESTAAVGVDGIESVTLTAGPKPVAAASNATAMANLMNETDAAAEKPLPPAAAMKHAGRVMMRALESGKQNAIIELRLDPPELGHIKLEVHIDGSRMRVTGTAADLSAAQLIQAQIAELREALAAADIQLDEFDIGWEGRRRDADEHFDEALAGNEGALGTGAAQKDAQPGSAESPVRRHKGSVDVIA